MSCRSAPTSTRTPRRAGEAVGGEVPPGPAQHRVARGRQAGEVRHRAAGDEPDGALGGQARAGRAASADATSSTAVCAGVTVRRPEFWSHALTSQSAASAAGCEPPMTKPKNRPDGIAVSPGSAARASSATTSGAGVGPLGQLGPQRGDHLVGRRPRAGPAAWAATPATRWPAGVRPPGPRVMSSMAGSSSPRRGSDQGRAGASGAVPVFSASAWGCSGCSASAR